MRLDEFRYLADENIQKLSGSDATVQEFHPQISQITQIGTTGLNLRNLRMDMVPFRMASHSRVAGGLRGSFVKGRRCSR